MPHSVIIGRLRAVEGDSIILGGNCRIYVPPTLPVEKFPIGAILTVVVHQESGAHLIADRIEQNPDARLA